MTIIESKLIREGGTRENIGGTDYHFAPNEAGDHVCEVKNEDHAERFLSIPEGYRLYRSASKVAPVEAPGIPASVYESVVMPTADPEPQDEAPAVEDRAALVARYTELYGKAPRANASIDKLRELIAAKQ